MQGAVQGAAVTPAVLSGDLNLLKISAITRMLMNNFLKINLLTIVGAILGALGGYLYWKYVGCTTGTCPITSKPLNSSAYGALMGGLLLSYFKTGNKPAG